MSKFSTEITSLAPIYQMEIERKIWEPFSSLIHEKELLEWDELPSEYITLTLSIPFVEYSIMNREIDNILNMLSNQLINHLKIILPRYRGRLRFSKPQFVIKPDNTCAIQLGYKEYVTTREYHKIEAELEEKRIENKSKSLFSKKGKE